VTGSKKRLKKRENNDLASVLATYRRFYFYISSIISHILRYSTSFHNGS
jgi:hypothetical protein